MEDDDDDICICLISCEKHIFIANRVALAAISRFFRAALTLHFDEAQNCEIRFGHLNSSQLRSILEYVETSQLSITAENDAEKVFEWADYLLIDELIESCVQTIIARLNQRNAIRIYRLAENRSSRFLVDRSWNYIVRNFDRIVESEDFADLNQEELISLLDNQQLKLANNLDMELDIVDQWVQSQELSNSAVCMNRQEIRETVMQQSVGRIRQPDSVLLAVGGWTVGPSNVIEVWNPRTEMWTTALTSIRDDVGRAFHAVQLVNGRLYQLGGCSLHRFDQSLREFDMDTMRWIERAPMHQRRCYVSCTHLNDEYVLALGGNTGRERTNTAEFYNPMHNQWLLTSPMIKGRSDADAINVDNRVYIIGGFDGIRCHSSSEVYDAESNNWHVLADMNQQRSGLAATVIDHGAILVCGGFDGLIRHRSAETLDRREGIWHMVASMKETRSNFAMSVISQVAVVVGGYNDVKGTLAECEQYDWRLACWQSMPNLTIGRSGVDIVKLDCHSLIDALWPFD